MKKLFLVIVCFSLLAACGGAVSDAPQNSANAVSNQTNRIEKPQPPILDGENAPKRNPAEAVQISVDTISLKTGELGEALIRLKVVEPFHINSNPPSEKNLIPTEVVFPTLKGFEFKKPIYPKGEMKKFTFSDKQISVYAGEIVIKLPLKVSNEAGKGELNQILKLKFQPCDDEVCFQPQTVNFTLPVNVN